MLLFTQNKSIVVVFFACLFVFFTYHKRPWSLCQTTDASVMGMPASVCQMSKAVRCVYVSTILLGQIANTVPHSTETVRGLVPLQTLPISVLVSTDTIYIKIPMFLQCLKDEKENKYNVCLLCCPVLVSARTCSKRLSSRSIMRL